MRLPFAAGAAALIVAAPSAALAGGDALLLGAVYRDADLRPPGPGVTTLTFIPGRGLIRSDMALGGPRAVQAPEADGEGFELQLSAPRRPSARDRVLGALGVADGRALGREARWFFFVAARGRALGYNLGDDRRGVALERGGFLGEGQAGLAYRVGDYQASLSYIRYEIDLNLFGVEDIDEDRGALTLTRFLGDPQGPHRGPFSEKRALPPPR